LQRAGKNGITDTLKHVEPVWHDIVFLHIRRFLKIRRFNKCKSNEYLGSKCLSMPEPNTHSGMINFVNTSQKFAAFWFLGFVPEVEIWKG
jgi:hypothetical protein